MKFLLLFLALPLCAQVESVRLRFGDDLRWADPAFDDTGWTAQNPVGDAWSWARYRVRVPEIACDPVIGVESATMEVYVEGRLIGRHGRLPPAFQDSPLGYSTFALPRDLAMPGRVVTIALRMWDPPGNRFRPMRQNPPALSIHSRGETPIYEQRAWSVFRGYAWSATVALVALLLVAVAGRSHQCGTELRLALAAWGAFAFYEVARMSCYVFPWSRGGYLSSVLSGILLAVIPLELMAVVVRLRPPWWMRLGQGFFALSQCILLAANLHFEAPAWTAVAGFLFLISGVVSPMTAFGILVRGNLRQRGDRALPILLTFALTSNAIARLGNARGCTHHVYVGGMEFALNTIGFTLLGLVLAAVMLARFRRAGEVAIQLQGQLAAARSVQEMLLTGGMAASPGYVIDTVYRPAAEVGGDFFRVLPAPGDATLVVIGDVSGKGLRAAMLASVMVGALLNRRSSDPAEVLAELNRAIMGQVDNGFVTCCAMLLEPAGRVTIASAGHPSPCCGGMELEAPSGLPLGIADDARYETATFQVPAADQIALVSDGVAEAANERGELFGFERTQALSRKSAREIADAARAWGQNDDITVLTLRSVSA